MLLWTLKRFGKQLCLSILLTGTACPCNWNAQEVPVDGFSLIAYQKLASFPTCCIQFEGTANLTQRFSFLSRCHCEKCCLSLIGGLVLSQSFIYIACVQIWVLLILGNCYSSNAQLLYSWVHWDLLWNHNHSKSLPSSNAIYDWCVRYIGHRRVCTLPPDYSCFQICVASRKGSNRVKNAACKGTSRGLFVQSLVPIGR